MIQAPKITEDCIKKEMVRLEVDVKFLTYVFGGGVERGSNDPSNTQKPFSDYDRVTPIRAASVRGQLRFWWRATIGARMESLAAMKHREALIWGAIKGGKQDDRGKDLPTPGAVGLTIDAKGLRPEPIHCFAWGEKNHPAAVQDAAISYGAFPLRPNDKTQQGNDPRSVLWKYHNAFALMLDVPQKYVDDIHIALSAWLTFGGYGARTTRGFGAVALYRSHEKLTDKPTEMLAMLERRFSKDVEKTLPDVPALSTNKDRLATLTPSRQGSQDAWSQALGKLQAFRQQPELGRNPRSASASRGVPAGRSRWPEPDAIRRLTGRHSAQHKPEHPLGNAFPRGAFGLPIIFHFMNTKAGEPADQTLQVSREQERAPSPLIVRPTSQAEPMAIWLKGMEIPETLYLGGVNQSVPSRVTAPIHQDRHRTLMHPDPLTAFMKFFR